MGLLVVLLAVSRAVAAVSGPGRPPPLPGRGRPPRPARLRAGTEQAQVVAALEQYVRDLTALRTSRRLPDLLTDAGVEAVVAARGALDVALRVARAVDGLDAALARAHELGRGVSPTAASAAALARMYDRRAGLLAALHDGLAQVQDLHAELLELSATLDLYGADRAGREVSGVSDRLRLLRRAVAEIDAAQVDAARIDPAAQDL